MSVFRIEKNRNYTVMSNYHFKDKTISLKAKGLLSQMLSLPENWDYTLKGLAHINMEKIDAIRSAVRELERAGYIVRSRVRDEKGHLRGNEYVIFEMPPPQSAPAEPVLDKPTLNKPTLENPTLDISIQGKPTLENPTQLNIYKTNNNKLNTDDIKYPSIYQREQAQMDGSMDRYNKNIDLIKSNIEYDTLIFYHDKAVIDEIVAVMAEVLTIETPYYTIEKKQYPSELVKQRFLEIDYSKLDAFMLEFTVRSDRIRNTKAYLITSLFNIPATADTSLSNMVRHDLYGNGRR